MISFLNPAYNYKDKNQMNHFLRKLNKTSLAIMKNLYNTKIFVVCTVFSKQFVDVLIL